MKKTLLPFFIRLASAMPLETAINLTGRKLILPFYHTVSNRELPHISNLYHYPCKPSFAKDLKFYLKYYTPIDLEELISLNANNTLHSSPKFLLTFDDGLRQVYDTVAPLLKEYRIPAVIFINPDFLDNKKLFFKHKASLLASKLHRREKSHKRVKMVCKKLQDYNFQIKHPRQALLSISYSQSWLLDEIAELMKVDFNRFLREEEPYLTTSQVNELINEGFHIGSHSIDHPEYNHLSLREQIFQTTESLSRLSNTFNLSRNVFSFPFTDFGVSQEFFSQLHSAAAGNPDMTFGAAGLKNENIPYHIQRIPVEEGKYSARKTVKAEYVYYMVKACFGKNTIKRKRKS